MFLLNLYIIKKFFLQFIALLAGFTLLFLIVNVIDNINDFIESSIPQKQIFQYYFLSMPSFISLALPMTTLLATIFTFAQLQKNHELTAIKSSGISLRKLSVNLIILGFLISAFLFVFDNTVVSTSNKERKVLESQYLDKLNKSEDIKKFHTVYKKPEKINLTMRHDLFPILNKVDINTNIMDKNNLQMLYIENYDFLNNRALNVKIQQTNNYSNKNALSFELEVDTMIYKKELISQEGEKLNEVWIRKGLRERRPENDMVLNKEISDDIVSFYMEDFSKFTENDLNSLLPKSEELNYWELKELSLRRPEEIKLKVDYNYKLAFSCTSFIMILFGIGLSIRRPKSNYATGIGVGIMVIFLYMLGMKFGQSLGYSKILSPFLSVWFINFIFLAIGIWLFSKIRT